MSCTTENLHLVAARGPQLLASLCVSSGCLCYGICLAYTSPALPSLAATNTSSLHLNTSQVTRHLFVLFPILGILQESWVASLLCLGVLIGSGLAVFLMDAVGRKASLLAFSVMSLFIGQYVCLGGSGICTAEKDGTAEFSLQAGRC